MVIPERYTLNTTSFANYWQHGPGKELLHKLSKPPDLQEANVFIPLLYEHDDIADAVINEVYLKEGFHKANVQIQEYLEKGLDHTNKAVPPSIHQLWEQIHTPPAWLNPELIKAGASLCQRVGVSSLIVLRDYCLMGGYESAAINKPLIFTEALKKGPVKRLAETLEFWVNITGFEALAPQHIGFKSILHTRLIHAYSRVAILKTPDWKTEKWGVPLNHWDMLATNLGFSLVYLVGLRKLGFQPTEKEVAGLFHFWKYVGFLLGIPENYLPDNETEAIKALYFWTMTQSPADQDSKALAHALTAEPLQVNVPRYKLLKKMLQQSHLAYNYYFLGKVSCHSLDLPSSFFGPVVQLSIWMNKIKEQRTHKNEKQYQKMVLQGRKEQEQIKHIYLHKNAGILKRF